MAKSPRGKPLNPASSTVSVELIIGTVAAGDDITYRLTRTGPNLDQECKVYLYTTNLASLANATEAAQAGGVIAVGDEYQPVQGEEIVFAPNETQKDGVITTIQRGRRPASCFFVEIANAVKCFIGVDKALAKISPTVAAVADAKAQNIAFALNGADLEITVTLDIPVLVSSQLMSYKLTHDADPTAYLSPSYTNGVTLAATTTGTSINVPQGVHEFKIIYANAPFANLFFKIVTGTVKKLMASSATLGPTYNSASYAYVPVLRQVTNVSSPTGVEGGVLSFAVSLNGTTQQAQAFTFSAAGSPTMVAGVDYSTTLNLPNGFTQEPTTITVPAGVSNFNVGFTINSDALIESNEFIYFTIGGVSGTGTVVGDTTTILSVSSQSVVEGATLVFGVVLSSAPTQAQTFPFLIDPSSTAVNSVDYTSSPTFTNGVTLGVDNITVPPGVTSFTVTYATVDDGLIESSETLTLTIGGVAGVGTINDNDAPATRTVQTVSSPIVTEGQTISFTVLLSGATEQVQNFAFTVGGTAIGGTDYATPLVLNNGVTISGGNMIVPSGISTFTASSLTTDDIGIEASETLILTIGGQSGTGTILDNDAVVAANAVELWANDATTAKYFADSQGVWNLFVGLGFNDPTHLDPFTRLPKDIPAGITVNAAILHDKREDGYIRPGTYYVTCDKALPLSIGGGNAVYTNITNGTGTASFTVQPSPSGIYNPSTGYTYLSLTILGVAGITGTVKFAMWHEDDTDYKNRGFISTPQWINQVKHLTGLRYMDALSTNGLLIQNPSQLLPEDSTHWGNNNGSDFCRHVPLAVIAKREIELFHVTGKLRKVHLNLPTGNFILLDAACDPATNAITSFTGFTPVQLKENFTDGQRVVVRPYGTMPDGLSEGLYYLKWDGTTLKLSNTLNGPDVDITSSGSFSLCSYSDPAALYLAAMQLLYNISHTIDGVTYFFRDCILKLLLEMGNEPWNGAGAFKTFYICGAVGSHMATGAFGDYLQGLKYFSLKAWKAAQLAGWDDSKIERILNCQVAWPEHVLPVLNMVDSTGIISADAAIKDLNVTVAIAPYFNVGNQATGASYNMIAWAADGAMSETDAQWRDRWLYGISLGAAGVARFCAQARAIKSDIRIISYEGGSHDDFFFTYEEWAGKYAMGKRINTFLHYGEYAAEIHQAYYDQVFVANGVLSFNQYYATGHYSIARVKTLSNSSHALTPESKVFAYTSTLDSPINLGDQVEIRSAANSNNSMSGVVTAHTPGASLTVNVTKVLGSGTFADWIIGTSLMSPWGLSKNNYEADNAVVTWWKNLTPYGIDSGVVTSVGNAADTAEGAGLVFAVTLAQAYTVTKRIKYAISGQVSSGDYSGVSANNGVTVAGNVVSIPAGVTAFNFTVQTTNDTVLEYNETLTLTIDGQSGTGTILFNDGGAASPDFAYIDDIINKVYPAVTPLKISNTEEEVNWPTNANWYFDLRVDQPQATKPGTPILFPTMANGTTISFTYETWIEAAAGNLYFSHQIECVRKSDSQFLTIDVSQTGEEGSGAYAGQMVITITNNSGETIAPATHKIVLRILKGAATIAFKQRLRNLYRSS